MITLWKQISSFFMCGDFLMNVDQYSKEEIVEFGHCRFSISRSKLLSLRREKAIAAVKTEFER